VYSGAIIYPVRVFQLFYLATYGFGKLIYKLDDPGIFIWCCDLFHMILQLFDKRIAGLIVFGQHDGSFNYLSSDRIRHSCYRALKNSRMLKEGTFYLERPNAVT